RNNRVANDVFGVNNDGAGAGVDTCSDLRKLLSAAFPERFRILVLKSHHDAARHSRHLEVNIFVVGRGTKATFLRQAALTALAGEAHGLSSCNYWGRPWPYTYISTMPVGMPVEQTGGVGVKRTAVHAAADTPQVHVRSTPYSRHV